MDNNNNWIDDKYPEPYKDILVFDLLEGYTIAHYDNVMNVFYSKETYKSLFNVIAWQSLPKMPRPSSPLKQRVHCSIYPKVDGVSNKKKGNNITNEEVQ